MAKKRKTLPKDFEELLSTSSIKQLKAIFVKCELDARGEYNKQSALAFDECPHELASWLVEQGADLHAPDRFGNTPLHNRADSRLGNIKSLLDLGANVNYNSNSKGTPLHSAAQSHNVENTAILLAHGARIDILNSEGYTALELALITCDNIDIVSMVELSKIYLNAGAQITQGMKERVIEIGNRFEFHRAGFAKKSVVAVSNALEELYRIFEVEPVGKRILHDGKYNITTNKKTWEEQHSDLWNLLVPSSGPAKTVQGEVIRITGRISNELDGNGGGNWDGDYNKMADALPGFLRLGNSLSETDLKDAEDLVKEIKRRTGDPERLCELGVRWVINNPSPLPIPNLNYKR